MTVTEIVDALFSLGLPSVLAAIGLYVLLRGELVFRYPARNQRGQDRQER